MPQKFPLNLRKGSREEPEVEVVKPARNMGDRENYLILPGRKHGSYEYPDMIVGMHRLGLNPEVGNAASQLGLTVQNTAREYNGDGPEFIGSIQWKPAIMLNLKYGGETLNPRQFIDLLEMLKSGKAFDGNGEKVSESKLVEILNEITQVKNPWRAEWLDADFKVFDGRLHMLTKHIIKGLELVPQYNWDIEGQYLASDSQIDATSFNDYGLATKSGNDFWQWYPRKDNNSVAGFDAHSDWAALDCDWDPTDSIAGLGVRHVRKKI